MLGEQHQDRTRGGEVLVIPAKAGQHISADEYEKGLFAGHPNFVHTLTLSLSVSAALWVLQDAEHLQNRNWLQAYYTPWNGLPAARPSL